MENLIANKALIEIEACDEIITIESNEETVALLQLEVIKTASCNVTAVGHQIRYCVTIKNESDVDLEDLLFKDELDPRTSYVNGSFTVNGTPATPTVVGHTITYTIPKIEDDETITICFRVMVES